MFKLNHSFIRRSLFASTLILSAHSFAVGPDINASANDVAIHGYDPVAYFTKSKPVQGKSKYSAVHDGAIYYFTSEEHRDTFKETPHKYAPAFGGFCAMGVALDKKLDTDPEAWKIVDGTLYFNLNKNVQKTWQQDIAGNIDKAKDNWVDIQYTPAAELE